MKLFNLVALSLLVSLGASAQELCAITCLKGRNHTTYYTVNNLDECIDRAGGSGCPTVKYKYQKTDRSPGVDVREFKGKLSFKNSGKTSFRVDGIQIVGGSNALDRELEKEAQAKQWRDSSSYAPNPDFFGVEAMRHAEFLKLGM
jgi:hypothetical protein